MSILRRRHVFKMCSFILKNDPPPPVDMLDPPFVEGKRNTLAVVGIMISSGMFRSPAGSHMLLEALCQSGNFPVAVRYLTRLKLRNDVTTYRMVIKELLWWSERRTTNIVFALFANSIKKPLHSNTTSKDGEEEPEIQRMRALRAHYIKSGTGRLHVNYSGFDEEDEAK
ncbi:hypothetical protein ES332_D13G260800v1 [Gossypium tomentosum]|uniref:Pentatricopeptide repeat-containing protein n=1 Tax=Gossypium tomentosum TaxID=34277 RepID=A0A5D2I1Y0_GOSTO|nr:hypothetical protein ES332_D13G260800v1 [Gossypium tomentosum]